MKIFSWNVNGIRAVWKRGQIQDFLKEFNPDILCLQETKIGKDNIEFDFSSYEEFWNSAEKQGYSGTAIFSKTKPINVINNLPDGILKKYDIKSDEYGDINKEGRIITAEFEDFFVVSVYVPNAKDDLSRLTLRYKNWDPALLEYLKELEKKKPVICAGDFNVAHTEDDLARPKQNEGKKGFTREEREGMDNLKKAGFIDTFRLYNKGNGYYTWWSHFAKSRERNVGWRIDYILVSDILKNKIIEAKIYPKVFGSDHCPLSIDMV